MSNTTLFGIVLSEVSGRPGWYTVAPSIAENAVTGTSIKRTQLAAGQRVAIIQAWDGGRSEYGFVETSYELDSLVNLDQMRAFALGSAPASCAMYRMLQAAGAKHAIYRPATVTAVGASTLSVADRFTGGSGTLSVSSDLAPDAFVVGDGVLISESDGRGPSVIGWWQEGRADEIIVWISGASSYWVVPRAGTQRKVSVSGTAPYFQSTANNIISDARDRRYAWFASGGSVYKIDWRLGTVALDVALPWSGGYSAWAVSKDIVGQAPNAAGAVDALLVCSTGKTPGGIATWEFRLWKITSTATSSVVILSGSMPSSYSDYQVFPSVSYDASAPGYAFVSGWFRWETSTAKWFSCKVELATMTMSDLSVSSAFSVYPFDGDANYTLQMPVCGSDAGLSWMMSNDTSSENAKVVRYNADLSFAKGAATRVSTDIDAGCMVDGDFVTIASHGGADIDRIVKYSGTGSIVGPSGDVDGDLWSSGQTLSASLMAELGPNRFFMCYVPGGRL